MGNSNWDVKQLIKKIPDQPIVWNWKASIVEKDFANKNIKIKKPVIDAAYPPGETDPVTKVVRDRGRKEVGYRDTNNAPKKKHKTKHYRYTLVSLKTENLTFNFNNLLHMIKYGIVIS